MPVSIYFFIFTESLSNMPMDSDMKVAEAETVEVDGWISMDLQPELITGSLWIICHPVSPGRLVFTS
jgi:hypothetical protein